MKPGQLLMLSYPPWIRYKAESILVQMLVPDKLKGQAEKNIMTLLPSTRCTGCTMSAWMGSAS
jgi:hypothetical protein